MVFDGDTAWVINHRDRKLIRLEGGRVRELATIGEENVAPERMALLDGSLWITGRGADLLKVDPDTGDVEDTIEIGGSGIDIVAAGGALWVPSRSEAVDQCGPPDHGGAAPGRSRRDRHHGQRALEPGRRPRPRRGRRERLAGGQHRRDSSIESRWPGRTPPRVEDFFVDITRGNPGSVKTVLASVVLALAVYQLILAAIGYRKLPIIEAKHAFFTHRASGDVIAVLLVLVALMCLGVYGIEDDYVLHVVTGAAAVVVLAIKVAVVRSGVGGRFLPVLGITLFALLADLLVHRHTRLPGGGGLMQLIGSIMVAFAIVAVTIALVTAKLGPFAEDDDGGGRGGDRQEQEDNTAAAATRTGT